MTCPICEQEVPQDHAVEWDNGEPAPESGKWGMSVCRICHDGVYGIISSAHWVQIVLQRERRLSDDRRNFLYKVTELGDEARRHL